MEIIINSLDDKEEIVKLSDVGACYPDDDVIYFSGVPCILSSARPKCDLPDSIKEALNSGDGTYRP
jgi:hypothetical protein